MTLKERWQEENDAYPYTALDRWGEYILWLEKKLIKAEKLLRKLRRSKNVEIRETEMIYEYFKKKK
jgi:hypothetical protein